jgi:hypothetical protein
MSATPGREAHPLIHSSAHPLIRPSTHPLIHSSTHPLVLYPDPLMHVDGQCCCLRCGSGTRSIRSIRSGRGRCSNGRRRSRQRHTEAYGGIQRHTEAYRGIRRHAAACGGRQGHTDTGTKGKGALSVDVTPPASPQPLTTPCPRPGLHPSHPHPPSITLPTLPLLSL